MDCDASKARECCTSGTIFEDYDMRSWIRLSSATLLAAAIAATPAVAAEGQGKDAMSRNAMSKDSMAKDSMHKGSAGKPDAMGKSDAMDNYTMSRSDGSKK